MYKLNLTLFLSVMVLSSGLISCTKEKKSNEPESDNFRLEAPVLMTKEDDLNDVQSSSFNLADAAGQQLDDETLLRFQSLPSNSQTMTLVAEMTCLAPSQSSYKSRISMSLKKDYALRSLLPVQLYLNHPTMNHVDTSEFRVTCAMTVIVQNEIGSTFRFRAQQLNVQVNRNVRDFDLQIAGKSALDGKTAGYRFSLEQLQTMMPPISDPTAQDYRLVCNAFVSQLDGASPTTNHFAELIWSQKIQRFEQEQDGASPIDPREKYLIQNCRLLRRPSSSRSTFEMSNTFNISFPSRSPLVKFDPTKFDIMRVGARDEAQIGRLEIQNSNLAPLKLRVPDYYIRTLHIEMPIVQTSGPRTEGQPSHFAADMYFRPDNVLVRKIENEIEITVPANGTVTIPVYMGAAELGCHTADGPYALRYRIRTSRNLALNMMTDMPGVASQNVFEPVSYRQIVVWEPGALIDRALSDYPDGWIELKRAVSCRR